MLTKSDLKAIRDLISDTHNNLKSEMKNDIITFKDQILSEIKNLREDITVVIGYKDQIEDHETRINKIEEVLEPQNN